MALVTGASRGLGREVAGALGAQGATVVVVARDPDGVAAAVAGLVAEGVDAVGHAVDLADAEAVRAVPSALGPLAAVDVLVNAAGVMSARTAKTLRTDDAEWRRVLGTNLDGAFTLTSTFVPGMVERRWGRVVHFSACLGRMSGPGTAGGLAPYRVSKAARQRDGQEPRRRARGRPARACSSTPPARATAAPTWAVRTHPRSAAEGADTAVWLACRDGRPDRAAVGGPPPRPLVTQTREVRAG